MGKFKVGDRVRINPGTKGNSFTGMGNSFTGKIFDIGGHLGVIDYVSESTQGLPSLYKVILDNNTAWFVRESDLVLDLGIFAPPSTAIKPVPAIESNVVPFVGGLKADDGKIPLELLPPAALLEVAKVLQFGSKKYSTWNWAKGLAYTRVLGAMLRHIFAYLMGEDKDPETGLSHIAHAVCEGLFILHYEKFKPSLDDRYKEPVK